MAELVADAIDRALRSKPKSARDAFAGIGSLAYLDNLTKIFVYLRDKDIFSDSIGNNWRNACYLVAVLEMTWSNGFFQT